MELSMEAMIARRRSKFQIRASAWHGSHFVSFHRSLGTATQRAKRMNEAVSKVVKCNCGGDCFEVFCAGK